MKAVYKKSAVCYNVNIDNNSTTMTAQEYIYREKSLKATWVKQAMSSKQAPVVKVRVSKDEIAFDRSICENFNGRWLKFWSLPTSKVLGTVVKMPDGSDHYAEIEWDSQWETYETIDDSGLRCSVKDWRSC